MYDLSAYLPQRVNSSRWLTWYTLYELRRLRAEAELVLPVCSLGTPTDQIAVMGDLVLPPLFHEALDESLKSRIVCQIERCFPVHELMRDSASVGPGLRVVELPGEELPAQRRPAVLAFSVDTAVEEHGPHLPLATDTIQSYSVLRQLAADSDDVVLAPPLDYGHLTWGLPFGFSVDLTCELLTAYTTRFTNALLDWWQPEAIYVVDVHGSIAHRESIVTGLENSRAAQWSFRWLHEPLVEFASARGDQHAGGVETALVEIAGESLLDRNWWPDRIDEIAEHQMSFQKAVSLSQDLAAFADHVREESPNGIVGDVRNYLQVDADVMFERMLKVAREDIAQLVEGEATRDAGDSPW